jgi:hypothetical protein
MNKKQIVFVRRQIIRKICFASLCLCNEDDVIFFVTMYNVVVSSSSSRSSSS